MRLSRWKRQKVYDILEAFVGESVLVGYGYGRYFIYWCTCGYPYGIQRPRFIRVLSYPSGRVYPSGTDQDAMRKNRCMSCRSGSIKGPAHLDFAVGVLRLAHTSLHLDESE